MTANLRGKVEADRRLHPGTLFIRFVKQIPEFVVGLPAFAALAADAGLGLVLLLALAGAGVALTITLLAWLRFKYGIGEGEIVIESGVFDRQRRVIPFDRIQDIDIEQRLLARLFGLAKVRIETGGAAKDEGSLDAVALEEAYRLREILRQGPAKATTGSAATPEEGEPILFRMDMRRLLTAGLFNFSLFFLVAIGGTLQYFDPLLDRYLAEPERLKLPSRETARDLGLYATSLILLIVVLLGVVTGILRTIARDYRFQLSKTATGLRRRRGLFTLSEVLIPLSRVQLAVIETGWLRKRFGWFALDFQTLSADAQQSGPQDAVPFARMEEITSILAAADIRPLPPENAYRSVSRRMIARRALALFAPAAIAVSLLSLFAPAALLLFLPLAIGALALVPLWRRHLYALDGGALYIKEGLLRPRLWIVPFGKAQTIGVRRSPFQRKLGLATVEIDTAGASAFRYPAVKDLEQGEAERLAARLLEEYRTARVSRTRASI